MRVAFKSPILHPLQQLNWPAIPLRKITLPTLVLGSFRQRKLVQIDFCGKTFEGGASAEGLQVKQQSSNHCHGHKIFKQQSGTEPESRR